MLPTQKKASLLTLSPLQTTSSLTHSPFQTTLAFPPAHLYSHHHIFHPVCPATLCPIQTNPTTTTILPIQSNQTTELAPMLAQCYL